MLRAVVELVRGEGLAGIRRRVVDELVALASRHAVRRRGHPAAGRLPRLAAVAGALDDLTEPPAGLRRVQAVRIGRGDPYMVEIPPRELRGAANSHTPLSPPLAKESSLFPPAPSAYTSLKPLLSGTP